MTVSFPAANLETERPPTIMPAKGTSRVTTRQKQIIAAGRLAGKTCPVIAGEIGVTTDTVRHLAVGPEVKGIISRIVASDELLMAGLMNSVVASLQADIASEKLTPEQRERARAQAVSVLQLGEPKLPDQPAAGPGALAGGGFFLSDVMTVYRQMVTGAPVSGVAE